MGKEQIYPLVTVGVIAYNSAKTIVETLDSVRSQTYPLSQIELLIADDCSLDKTVKIVETWLKEYGGVFESTRILKSTTNQGIAHNTNQALRAAKGEYYKGIAADDILLETCIEEYVDYMTLHPDVSAMFCRVQPFGTKDEEYAQKVREMFDISFFDKTIDEQLNYLYRYRTCLPAPTSFLRIKFLREHNIECDERIPFIEDYPLWINLLRAGARFAYLDKENVLYRVGGITSSYSENYFRSERLFVYYYRYPAWVNYDEEDAVQTVVNYELELFREIKRLKASKAYRIGKLIVGSLSYMKNLLAKKNN